MKTVSGFTLVELLAVIVVVLILSIIAFPMISGLIQKTSDSKEEHAKDRIIVASREYVNSNASIQDNLMKLNDEYNIEISLLIEEGLIEEDILDSFDEEIYVKVKVEENYKLKYYVIYGKI